MLKEQLDKIDKDFDEKFNKVEWLVHDNTFGTADDITQFIHEKIKECCLAVVEEKRDISRLGRQANTQDPVDCFLLGWRECRNEILDNINK